MNKTEQTTYLRNIMHVAMADGFLDTSEVAFMERTRASIGATKTTLKKAMKDLNGLDLLGLARVSDRVRCIEDMLGCAIADGELPPEEADLIMGTARAIGLPDSVIEVILEEVQQRQVGAALPCPACGTEVVSESTYCSECGAHLHLKQQTELALPEAGILVSFAKSSSAPFADALALAKAEGSYQETASTPPWFGVTFPRSRADAAGKLASHVGKLRNRKVHVDGEELDWKSVFKFATCAEARSKAYRPEGHCFGDGDSALNCWGCRQLGMKWSSFSSLFKSGAFSKPTEFVFDKQQIAYKLNQRAEAVSLCPHFNRDLVAAAFQLFPKSVKVDVNGEGSWEHNFVDEPTPTAIKVQGRYGDTNLSDGVRPRDPKIIMKLIAMAAAKCGVAVDLAAVPAG